ncbi:uncharacterized protein LOC115798077 [Archocentrus centrarchus]|uniref:uncharacterized protein LOC115798077 n=1 Tax=Archocentrus centrarchus TaxID=63155 RepID=UPI0011EA2EDE|nr:lipopolysaccharide-induced tumor necrosis factor-alpha factor [Archocentrus centrarchus]XP_030610630.1 lipopolysaccharide-induced tumor necrosis factor-alpha factor [Archocentrus centrarchus]
MENSDQEKLFHQSSEELPNEVSDTGETPEPEQEQQDESEPDPQPESNQETSETRSGPPPLAAIEFRIQQLQNRRFFLQKMQNFTKKSNRKSDHNPEQTNSEDDDGSEDELEIVQKELDELLVKKEELEKECESSTPTENGGHHAGHTFYKNETPYGGIYTLPPAQVPEEDVPQEQNVETEEPVEIVESEPAVETLRDLIVPVNSLTKEAALTRCPSCEQIMITQTQKRVGETAWLACCMCSMIGCVAGCCLIPFYMNRFKDIRHQCSHCQSTVHTFHPF